MTETLLIAFICAWGGWVCALMVVQAAADLPRNVYAVGRAFVNALLAGGVMAAATVLVTKSVMILSS